MTPFGRFYYPLYRNNFDDSPFIRSEAILFRETGLLGQWDPEGWVFTAALTNGGFEQDTNSSKALVARAGIDLPYFALRHVDQNAGRHRLRGAKDLQRARRRGRDGPPRRLDAVGRS